MRRLRADGSLRLALGKAVKAVFDIQDLVNLILSFADDEALHKMSSLNKRLRGTILSDLRYQVRIVTFKFKMSQQNLDRVMAKIQSGELVDTRAWNEDRNKGPVELYLNQLALKYPTLTNSFHSMKANEKARLLNRISGIPTKARGPIQARNSALQKPRQVDYMGDPVVTESVLNVYGSKPRRNQRSGKEVTLSDIQLFDKIREEVLIKQFEDLRQAQS